MDERAIERHRTVFSPELFNSRRAVIAGVGAGGLTVALELAKLGVQKIAIYDPDVVEIANLGPSLYGWQHVGKKKAEMCADILSSFAHVHVEVHAEDVKKAAYVGEVLFLCVDSNDLKKEILTEKDLAGVEFVFEGRMTAHTFLNHAFDPKEHMDLWLHYYEPDKNFESTAPGCGAPQVSVGPTAHISASIMVTQFIQWFAMVNGGPPIANQVFGDLRRYSLESQIW